MSSMNISIRREAYDFLNSLKERDASFSDVILKFKDEEKSSKNKIMKYFGALKNENIDWNAKEKRMKEFRNNFSKRLIKNDRA
mgnify:CR=1 FL=1